MATPSTTVHQRVTRQVPGGGGGGGGGGATTDFGTSIVPSATTPKEMTVVNGTVQSGTVAGTVTFAQDDPNGGTWGALYDGTTGRIAFTRINFSAEFSLSTWVKTTSSDATSGYDGNTACVIFGDHSNSIAFSAGITSGKWEARRFNGAIWQTVTHPDSVNDGNWHHVALSYDAGALLLYVDGVVEVGAVSSGQTGGCDTLGAGYLDGSGYQDFFPGSLYLPTLYQGMIWEPFPLT